MRITTLLVAVALLGFLVATPTASAGHMGPTCTHEYVDYYKQIDDVAQACAKSTIHWLLGAVGIQVEWPF